MLLSHLGKFPCVYANLKFAAKSPKMMIDREKYCKKKKPTKKKQVRPYECLRSSNEPLPILTNFLRTLRSINNQFADFLANPIRMSLILKNAIANLANACERLTNETTTQRVFTNVSLCHLFISINRVIF